MRAYTASALGALQGAGIITFDVYAFMRIAVSYSDYQRLAPLLSSREFRIDEVNYAESVEILGSIRRDLAEALIADVIESTSGRAEAVVVEERFDC